ncbi:TIGR04282 family arsenosugar biosynthesis glycosyltransferase [Methylovulum sp.]|nr:TIGR04282 family arsenosugar biosynthesis glycosyltransferase [Methylovulum sp.]
MTAIAIFVKTPGLSPVKTRLAATLGKDAAESFHLQAANTVAATLSQLSPAAQGYFAVAETEALNHPHWQALPCIAQGDGGLGERLARVYQFLQQRHGAVMLIGADSPQMTLAVLSEGIAWLGGGSQPRLVYGPCTDGGFWLIGGNCAIDERIWTDVSYSRADTGSQLLKHIKHLGEIKHLPTLGDVDEAADLGDLQQALQQLPTPLPEQRQLLDFLASFSFPSPQSW